MVVVVVALVLEVVVVVVAIVVETVVTTTLVTTTTTTTIPAIINKVLDYLPGTRIHLGLHGNTFGPTCLLALTQQHIGLDLLAHLALTFWPIWPIKLRWNTWATSTTGLYSLSSSH